MDRYAFLEQPHHVKHVITLKLTSDFMLTVGISTVLLSSELRNAATLLGGNFDSFLALFSPFPPNVLFLAPFHRALYPLLWSCHPVFIFTTSPCGLLCVSHRSRTQAKQPRKGFAMKKKCVQFSALFLLFTMENSFFLCFFFLILT